MLPDGASILPADMDRIIAAQDALLKTKNAHAVVVVPVNLHVHYEYPKHVTLGEKTVTVNNKEEEDQFLAANADNHEEQKAESEEQKTPVETARPAKKKGWA